MRKHISIFTFLLCAFAAVGPLVSLDVRANVHVFGYGVYSPEGTFIRDADETQFITPHDRVVYPRDITESGGSYPVTVTGDTPGWTVDHWVYQNVPDSSYRKENEITVPGSSGQSAVYITDASSNYSVSYAVYFRYIKYNLTYDSKDGTPKPSGGTYSYDTQFQLAAAPTRTGHTFDGWLASSVGKVFAAGETVSGANLCLDTWHEDYNSVTLTAQWTPHTYKVHFDGNGATSGSMEDQSFTYGEDAKELSANAFEKEDYVFDGWATNAILGGVVYQDEQKVQNLTTNDNAIVNLYARWTQMHEVTFKEHSMFGGGVLKVDHVKDGEDAEPPSNPEHDGFKFLGWSKGITNVRQDLAVTAEYEGTPYYVVYHANDGSGRTTQQEFKHGVEKPLASSTTFLRTGYTLKGWMTDATSTAPDYECGASVLNLTMGDSFDLYAFWKPIAYKVHFDGNDATEGSMDDVTLDYGASFEVPECKFTKTGCEFRFWEVLINKVVVTNYPAGVTVSNLTSKAGDIVTFRADWIGLYTVAFNGNGGGGSMTNVTYETGVEYALPSNAFTKTGYGFYGWATSQEDADALKKPAYTNRQTVVDLAKPGETFTLFAEWHTNSYTVVFNPGGATGTMADQAFFYDQPQALRDCTFDRGDPALWSFVGWTNSAAGGLLYTNQETVVNLTDKPDGRVELMAVWKSELSDLARAMGCDNLNWKDETETWYDSTAEWTEDGQKIPCARIDGGTASMDSSPITTNGVLHFWWKATGERLSVQCLDKDSRVTWSKRLDDEYSYDVWNEANVIVSLEDLKGDRVYLSFLHRNDGTCYIAKMTWTPEGGGEPTPGDPIAVTAAGIEGNVFSLTIPTVNGTDYGVWTNADLTIDSWGLMGEPQKGEGQPMEFKWTILPELPQLFFKAHKVEYK